MPWVQFVAMAVVSIVFTMPAVRFIPRARTSPTFERVLWVGTFLLSFLSAWLAIGYLGPAATGPTPSDGDISQIPWVPIVVGAAAGAIALNLLLWVMDYIAPPAVEEGGEDSVDGDYDSDSDEEI